MDDADETARERTGGKDGSRMTSTRLMQGLLAIYLVIASCAAWEQNWPRLIYWIGAALIMIGVLWMPGWK